MSSTLSAIKTLLAPAIVSLILFLGVTFVAIPAWRRYRNRYSQYLPLESISNHTSSIRHRITARLGRMLLPSTWSFERHFALSSRGGPRDSSDDDDLEQGEELADQDTWPTLERQIGTSRPDNTRRLSRDLEQGFRDDSDDSEDSD
jgi:hypothetical protein